MPERHPPESLGGEFVGLLDRVGRAAPLPRVRALYVPPLPDNWHKRSAFCAVELDDGSVGLSYISLGTTHQRLSMQADSLVAPGGARLHNLIGGLRGSDPMHRAVGMAALNAVTRWLFDRAGFIPESDTHALAGITPDKRDHVGMVGLFKPLVSPVLESGARLTVLELDSAVAGAQTNYEITLDRSAVRNCTQALCTSTVLINDTLDEILRAFSQARKFVLIGPGAACIPDPLFARGVTALGGTWVTDGPALVDALTAGVSWGRYAHKFVLDRQHYPGLPALVARL